MANSGYTQKDEGRVRLDDKLPFVSDRSDIGGWVYDHRAGILISLIIYLLALIMILCYKISLDTGVSSDAVYVEFERTLEEAQALREELRLMEMAAADASQYRSDVRNVASDMNARLDAGLKDSKGSSASDIYDEARAMEQRLGASRSAYEQGLNDANTMLESGRQGRNRESAAAGKGETSEGDSKVKGKVTVSYSLEGRKASNLHIPAYQCEGGGEVTVSITVNRNGVVVSASATRTTGGDSCLTEMATKAANASRFNVDASAPERQQGTITYIFVPQ